MDKLERYRRVGSDLDPKFDRAYARLLLFVFPSPRREASARTVFTDDPWVRVATTVAVPGWKVPPTAPIWAPVGGVGAAARRLIDLGAAWPRRGTTTPTSAVGDAAGIATEDDAYAEDAATGSDADYDDAEEGED